MSDLQIRPYADGDAAAVADLMNTVDLAHGGEPGFTESEVRGYTSTWVGDPDVNTRVVTAEDDTLVAAGLLFPPPDGGAHIDLFGAVRPGWEGRGIGREMLAWQWERAQALHAATAPDAEWYAETGASADDAGAARLFARFGFTPIRYFFHMEAPLDGQTPIVELPDRVAAVPFTDDMSRTLYESHMEAFSDHWGFQRRPYEKWVETTVRSDEFRGDLSRIGLDGDKIAGYVLAYDNLDGVEYIGQVGTRRPWRRRGLASALLSASMAAGLADGKKVARLGVDAESPTGAVGVYERLGYFVRHKYVASRRTLDRS
jgi:ribosomal protein S18 acetylase RimI-like enzyme